MKRFVASIFLAVTNMGLYALPLTEDYQVACQLAHDYELPLAVIFSGSDWSLESREFKQMVLKDPSFDRLVKNRFVFVQLDFPEAQMQDAAQLAKNYELKERFGIKSFPCILLLDSKQREISRISFSQMDPKSFVDHMLEIHIAYEKLCQKITPTNLRKVNLETLESLYQEAKELQTPRLIKAVLQEGSCRDAGTFFPMEEYVDLLREGKGETDRAEILKDKLTQRDPEDSSGVRMRLAVLDAQQHNDEPEKAVSALTGYIDSCQSSEIPNLWKLHLLISDYFSQMGEEKKAEVYAIKAEEGASLKDQTSESSSKAD